MLRRLGELAACLVLTACLLLGLVAAIVGAWLAAAAGDRLEQLRLAKIPPGDDPALLKD